MQIAIKAKKDPGEVSRLLPLAFLAPSIVKSILTGTQPISLTNNELIRLAPTLPLEWKQQQSLLGFDQ